MSSQILSGCNSTPLASYLKAMGIFRVLTEQKDSAARGWWQGTAFAIETALSREELATYFCREYEPTPIVSPWNGGSGFYLGDARDGIDAIATSTQKRFERYRAVIEEVRTWPEIPAFETVEKITNTLQAAMAQMRPGKKRDDILATLEKIEATTPPRETTGEADPQNIRLQDIEERAKRREEPNAGSWKEWWNELKKARSTCNNLIRSQSKNVIMSTFS